MLDTAHNAGWLSFVSNESLDENNVSVDDHATFVTSIKVVYVLNEFIYKEHQSDSEYTRKRKEAEELAKERGLKVTGINKPTRNYDFLIPKIIGDYEYEAKYLITPRFFSGQICGRAFIEDLTVDEILSLYSNDGIAYIGLYAEYEIFPSIEGMHIGLGVKRRPRLVQQLLVIRRSVASVTLIIPDRKRGILVMRCVVFARSLGGITFRIPETVPALNVCFSYCLKISFC